MTRLLRPLAAALLLAFASLMTTPAQAQSTAVTYQGELKQAGARANGDFEFRFRVFDNATVGGGTLLAESIPAAALLVQDGRFTASLDFSLGIFDGSARFLQIEVRAVGATEYALLSPRQPLTSAPGANVARLALASANQSVSRAALQNAAVGALQIDDGQVQRRVDASCPAGESIRAITSLGLVACEVDDSGTVNAWAQGGNGFGAPGVLGTTDAQPLEFRVHGARVGRISGQTLPNVLFGDSGNTIGSAASAATVSGGGWASLFGAGNGDNAAYDNGGTVAGGIGNTVGTDDSNNSHQYSSIGGGFYNTASGAVSVVSGGQTNTASGEGSAVPGGFSNVATGDHSFAAGRAAKAAHNNSFVWNGTTSDFATTGAGQFMARAPGGFGFNRTPAAGGQFALTASGGLLVNAPSMPPGIDAVIGSRDSGNTDVWFKSGSGNIGFNFAVTGSDATNSGMYIARYDGASFTDYALFRADGNLQVFFDTPIKPNGGAWAGASDARLKRNVQPLNSALDRLLQLQGVTYEYREDIPKGYYIAGRQTGFIAQEVERVFPNWVHRDPEGFRLVAPTGFEALAVEALREVKNSSDARIEALERDNAELRARLQRLEQVLLRDRL